MKTSRTLLAAAALALVSAPAAAGCEDPAGFPHWLDGVREEAAADGVSRRAIDEGLAGVTPDPEVLRKDRNQGVFRQSFEQFSQRMVPPRIAKARALRTRYADVFSAVERRYGVPAPVLLAIWGLETDFGASNGNFRTIRALATLAYDCRRAERFRTELIDALRMVQEGAIGPSSRGAWAGEIGQTQFMPSTYLKYATSLRGGTPDLNRSVPDVMASTARFLQGNGWQRGAGWEPGSANFAAIQEWNKAPVYSRTIAYFATRIAGDVPGDGEGASARRDGSQEDAVDRGAAPRARYRGEASDYGDDRGGGYDAYRPEAGRDRGPEEYRDPYAR